MNTKPNHIARCAQLAMVLEVSATPKPGNIDRDHNYIDTRFEHFLASAIGVYPVMEKAAHASKGVGRFIKEAVIESSKWQRGGNTHFGAFILLIPLVMAAGRSKDYTELRPIVFGIVHDTDSQDAVELYEVFAKAGVRVKKIEQANNSHGVSDASGTDLCNKESIDIIKRKGITLYDLMVKASGYDLIASEWVNGYPITFGCAESIYEKIGSTNINDAVVWTFLEILSRNPDTFIQTKFDNKKAEEVSSRAASILKGIHDPASFASARDLIKKFDSDLIKEKVNPGSTADIIIAGLFIDLFRGMRF